MSSGTHTPAALENAVGTSTDIEWLRLRQFGWQFGEAGVIQAVASKLECNNFAVEFGAGASYRMITVNRLIASGWKALLIEGDTDKYGNLVAETKHLPNVTVLNQMVEQEGDNALSSTLSRIGYEHPDVLVIDIDGIDYHIWKSCGIRAKIVCVEHHDTFDTKTDHTVSVIPDSDTIGVQREDRFYNQANIVAIEELGASLGYTRVWSSRVNSVFVLDELYDTVASIPEEPAENKYAYDAFGCKRSWGKIDNPKVALILSQPRIGFMDHSDRLIHLAMQMKFDVEKSKGAFWDRDIECTTMLAIHKYNPDFLLYSDYDSVFDPSDVAKLLDVINNDPTIGAIGSVQMSRHDDRPLVFEADKDYSGAHTDVDFQHFGLTLIRRQVFEELPHPWFWCTPGVHQDGTVGWDAPGRSDADITFWRQMKTHNMRVMQHNEVVIGHMIIAVKWPKDTGYGVQLQPIEMYNRHGKPATAKLNQDIYREQLKRAAEKVTNTNG